MGDSVVIGDFLLENGKLVWGSLGCGRVREDVNLIVFEDFSYSPSFLIIPFHRVTI